MDAANFNIDGHYPVRELWVRAKSCWARILAHESRSVLVVAHNAVNQALVATAIGTVLLFMQMSIAILQKSQLTVPLSHFHFIFQCQA